MQQITEPLLCPTCRRVLEQIEADATDPYHWYCDECDTCYQHALFHCLRCAKTHKLPEAEGTTGWTCPTCSTHYEYSLPPKTKEPMRCKYCQHVLEYDKHVRDDYKMWCSGCNACFNEHGKPQPGQYIYMRVPDEDEPTQAAQVDANHVQRLEAVAAAAVGLFTRHGKDLIYMPSAVSREAVKKALTELLTTGWRPK